MRSNSEGLADSWVEPEGAMHLGMTTMNGNALLDRCIAGEAAAWRELHRCYYPTVRSFLRRLGLPASEGEDAAQEVFLQLFKSLPRFERRSELKTWLYRLCLTQAHRARRRIRWRTVLPRLLGLEPEAPPPCATIGMSDEEAHRRVRGALEHMKALHRDVFVLYELEGLSGEEVARVVQCPVATVWRRLHHARREFTELIERGGFARSET